MEFNWEIGRRSSILFRFDGYDLLLTKSKETFEQDCTEIETTIATQRGQRKGSMDSFTRYVSRHTCPRVPVMTEVDERVVLFKEVVVQLTLLPCFVEMYKRMFHLAK